MQKNNISVGRENSAKGGEPLHNNTGGTFSEQIVRQTWLNYYNDYLRAKNIITEEEWRKMRRLIG